MSILRNTILNFLGSAIPAIIAIPAIAYLARALTIEQFTLVTLAWALIGYSSVFDGGLSRAVILFVAKERKNSWVINAILGTASLVITLFSLFFMGLLILLSEWLCSSVFNVSAPTLPDASSGILWLSFTIPPFLFIQIYQGYFEGMLKFREINIFRSWSGATNFLFPCLGVFLEPTFTSAMIGLFLSRFVSAIVLWGMVNKYHHVKTWIFDKTTLVNLFKFGGWITVSNIISPIMASFDRFILSSFIGAQKSGFYTAPSELIARMSIVPISVSRAFFPSVSGDIDRLQYQTERRKALFIIIVAALCCALPLLIFPTFILKVWLGTQYSVASASILQILAVGYFFNAMAHIPFASIQSRGRSDITAKIHLIELCFYLVLLWYLVTYYGMLGVAVAWSCRVIVDYVLLNIMDYKTNDLLKN